MDNGQDNPKPQPPAADPIAKMLGIEGGIDDRGDVRVTAPAPDHLPVDLPVVDAELISDQAATQGAAETVAQETMEPKAETVAPEDRIAADVAAYNKTSSGGALKVVKTIAPYVGIFVIGIFVYYYFFSSSTFSFTTLFPSRPAGMVASAQTSKSKQLAALEKTDAAAYNIWIKQFFFDVTDAKIIDPETDYSGNGLTNFQKYLLDLNPKVYDTIGKGYADGITVTNGLDPATAKPLAGARKDIVDTYFDTQAIRDRVTSSNLNGGPGSLMGVTPTVAAAAVAEGIAPAVVSSASNPGASSAGSSSAYQPAASKAVPVAKAADGSAYENALGINLNIPGALNISKLGISAPVFFSKSVNAMYDDLKKGVSHYTGTPLPGDHGTSYIVGHSSYYFWVHSSFKKIFASLDQLKTGDTFTITVTLQNGQQKVLSYKVSSTGLYKPDDQRQFINYASSRVALSTCWPPDTTAERFVAFGDLQP
jgi:LPXTG-site transpeptidase (sortase) family protein